jgi:hypothetical protein
MPTCSRASGLCIYIWRERRGVNNEGITEEGEGGAGRVILDRVGSIRPKKVLLKSTGSTTEDRSRSHIDS